MATASLIARVSATGAAKATTDLKRVGTQAQRTESNVIQMGASFRSAGRNAAAGIAAIDGPLGGISSRITAVTTVFTSGTAAATAFGLSIAGMGFILAEGIAELDRMNVELAKSEALLLATGSASGKTGLQLQQQAQAIALATLASTEGIQQAQSRLLTFDKVQGEVFNDAISLAQDLATVFGGTAASQATLLGKALQDPIRGLTSLTRVGVIFTDQQSDQIRVLAESGRTLEAQALLVEALKKQVGGAGESVAANSLAGKVDTMGQLWSESSAKIAESSGALYIAQRIFDGMIISLDALNKALEPKTTNELFNERLEIVMKIASLEEQLLDANGTAAAKNLRNQLAALRQQSESLGEELRASADADNAEIEKRGQAHLASQIKLQNDEAAAKQAYREKQAEENQKAAEKQAALDEAAAKRRTDAIAREAEFKRQALNDDADFALEISQRKADADKAAEELKKQQQKEQLSSLSSTTDNIGALLGEQSSAYKALAITEATISTYLGAQKAFAGFQSLPQPYGLIAGTAAAGVAVAAGLKNVASITSAREQGGVLAAGQTSSVAERNEIEFLTPQSSSRVRTANQMKSIMGEGGSNSVSLTVIDQSSGDKEYTQETKTDGEIVLLIRNTVSNDLSGANTQISKSITANTNATRRRG